MRTKRCKLRGAAGRLPSEIEVGEMSLNVGMVNWHGCLWTEEQVLMFTSLLRFGGSVVYLSTR